MKLNLENIKVVLMMVLISPILIILTPFILWLGSALPEEDIDPRDY